MHPRPSAETRDPPRPSFRCFIFTFADDRGVNTGNAQCKSQRCLDTSFEIAVAEEGIVELTQSFPIDVVVGVCWLVAGFQCRVGNWALRDYPDIALSCQRQG